MHGAFVKISVSLPDSMYAFLKDKSLRNGGVPVSRLIAQAVDRMAKNDARGKAGKGGRK